MAKLTQTRRRSALAEGSPMLSYSHGTDTLDMCLRSDADTPGGKGTYFTLNVGKQELERAYMFVQERKPHDYKRTEAAAETMAYELGKDLRAGLTNAEQLAKALDMAVTMLKHVMPHGLQDENATLAYISSVNDKAQGNLDNGNA